MGSIIVRYYYCLAIGVAMMTANAGGRLTRVMRWTRVFRLGAEVEVASTHAWLTRSSGTTKTLEKRRSEGRIVLCGLHARGAEQACLGG